MKNSIRKERFIRVSANRLKKAIAAIDALEKLSNRSNYEYSDDDVNYISGRLMSKVKLVMASFGSFSPKERFDRLVKQDELQYKLLQESDPEVYHLISSRLQEGTPIKNLHDSLKNSDLKKDEIEKVAEDLKITLEKLNKIWSSDKVQDKDLDNADNDFFIKNPEFNMERMYAQHNIDRLNWIKSGRTRKDIMSVKSPYRINPDPRKREPIQSLKWDIDQGRVIQAPNNKIRL